MGLSLHIHGLFSDLADRFRNTRAATDQLGECSRRAFVAQYKNCIDFQNEIYEIVKETQHVFSDMFFVQFAFTIIAVCMQAYLATQVS